MPTIADLQQSKFLKKEDVNPPKLVTIRGYSQVNVAMENEPAEMKYGLQFGELDKPLVLNSLNGQLIAQICGSDDFDDWIGKKVVLYVDPTVSFGGKVIGGIRVRAPRVASPPDKSAGGQIAKPMAKPTPPPAMVALPPDISPEPADDDVPF